MIIQVRVSNISLDGQHFCIENKEACDAIRKAMEREDMLLLVTEDEVRNARFPRVAYVPEAVSMKDIADLLRIAAKKQGCSPAFPRIRTFNKNGKSRLGLIFNPPATIVYWEDGTKTVVMCREDTPFVPEEGLRWAVLKKMFGDDKEFWQFVKGSSNGKQNKYLNWLTSMVRRSGYKHQDEILEVDLDKLREIGKNIFVGVVNAMKDVADAITNVASRSEEETSSEVGVGSEGSNSDFVEAFEATLRKPAPNDAEIAGY